MAPRSQNKDPEILRKELIALFENFELSCGARPARRSSCWRIMSKLISTPAGTPSNTPPMARPCDSPKEVKTKFFPRLFMQYCICGCKITKKIAYIKKKL